MLKQKEIIVHKLAHLEMLHLTLVAPMSDRAQAGRKRCGSGRHGGFTLVELIMTMVIIGILAAVAAPRFFDNNVFQTRGITDQVQASLRYAQKIAIAQRRRVSLNLTTAANTDCGTALVGGNVLCQIALPSGVTITPAPPQVFIFDALGRPVNALGQPIALATVAVAGSGMTSTIRIEAETGYVHQ